MANENGWGDGSVNNAIGWGQGANNAISWGKSHLDSWSGATDIDGGNAPINTVAPALSGTAQEGQTLTCSTGTWSGSPTYTYQWKRNGNNIGSATNSTYTLVTADVGQSIKCTVTATNFSGSANADSNTVVPISAFTGLLDTYSGASAAYSLRKLRSAYTGNAIRVRRSSDNTEQNIGFVNNVLDTASLLTFCGAGSGFVTTWYDQSGNVNNSVQTTAINQPRIVNAGVIESVNSKPACYFDGVNDAFGMLDITNIGDWSLYMLQKRTAAGTKGIMIASNGDGINFAQWSDNNFYIQRQSGSTSFYRGASDSTFSFALLEGYNISNVMSAYKNNSAYSLGSQGSFTVADGYTSFNQIGKYGLTVNSYSLGHCSEIIIYSSNQSSNRTGISSNINSFYTIY